MVVAFAISSSAQPNFQLKVNTTSVQVPGVQSYAWAQSNNNELLIIGGRIDGLHRRQPFAAFDPAGNNDSIYVIDPTVGVLGAASVNTLSTGLQEQLQSTNMQFIEMQNHLIITGGYGWSPTQGEFVTHDKLTVVDVNGLVSAIVNQQAIAPYFRQVTDSRVQVTGGYLGILNDTLFLVGGQLFEGAYNPQGPTHGPGFNQVYVDGFKRFTVQNLTSGTPSIQNYVEVTDANTFHRRDYNLSLQLAPDGTPFLTAFSGVFQPTQNLPWLDLVEIHSSSQYQVPAGAEQKLNQYHTAHVGIWDSLTGDMHTAFLGGIGQYYVDPSGQILADNEVPFINTISIMSRDAQGNWQEYYSENRMPALLGASAEFIPNNSLPYTPNTHVLRLHQAQADSLVLGWVVGGIESSAPNVFFTNTGTQSWANFNIMEVVLYNDSSLSLQEVVEENVVQPLVKIYPNPSDGKFTVELLHPLEYHLVLSGGRGSIIDEQSHTGPGIIELAPESVSRGRYWLEVQTDDGQREVHRLMIHH